MEAFVRPQYSAAEGRGSGSSGSDQGGGSGMASSSQKTTSTRGMNVGGACFDMLGGWECM